MPQPFLTEDDYIEPICPLCNPKQKATVPTDRILEKLDAYLGGNDYAGAERHLAYWLAEAEAYGDLRGALTVVNEQIGLFRKTAQKEKGLCAMEKAQNLLSVLDLSDTVVEGTTLVNAATAYKAFGMAQTALPLYERARTVYEKILPKDDKKLGGLYNNMALTLAALGDFDGARTLYRQAIAVMEKQERGELEVAITYLNLCDLIEAEYGRAERETEITALLEKAEALLDTPTLPRDGYYAFVLEKCAPVFGYYGYFLTEARYRAAAKEIYERS